tara:strand:- start:6610 stop:6810 length:201 start_codon:yes stop_codon:yes gene_type:complete
MIINYCDVALFVKYCYEESEPQTWDYPGSPHSAEIESVTVNGVDIYDLLSVEQLHDIELLILESYE